MSNSKRPIPIKYPKGKECYVFIFDESRRADFLEQLDVLVRDPELNFTAHDAACMRVGAASFSSDGPLI